MSGNLGASTTWNPLWSAIGQYGDCCTFTCHKLWLCYYEKI